MKRRLGEHTQPSAALLERHIQWTMDLAENQYQAAVTPAQQRKACRIALTTLFGWLGWLRAKETFGIKWEDVEVVKPEDGPTMALPKGLGFVILKLLPQIKSSQSSTADVALAYSTGSGLSSGLWLNRLRGSLDHSTLAPGFILCYEYGRGWTSHYLRHTFLCPFLETQQQLGNPALQQYNGRPGNSIPQKFWSFHCHRRGARTHVSRKQPNNVRKAESMEILEHARWRKSRGSMDMPAAYLEWSLEDRIMLPRLCM